MQKTRGRTAADFKGIGNYNEGNFRINLSFGTRQRLAFLHSSIHQVNYLRAAGSCHDMKVVPLAPLPTPHEVDSVNCTQNDIRVDIKARGSSVYILWVEGQMKLVGNLTAEALL
jgi:hypothetical protein